MTENLSFIFILIILICLSKLLIDNIFFKKSPLSLSFIIILISSLLFEILSKLINIHFNIFNLLFLLIILNIINFAIKKKYNFKPTIKSLLSFIFGFAIATLSVKYVQYISFGEYTDSILYISEFLNDSTNFFYHFFNNLYTVNNSITINSSITFIFTTCLIFYSLLIDTIFAFPYTKKNKVIASISLVSYLLFFISFSTMKFTYINYLWIIFPINQIMYFTCFEKDNLYSDLIIISSLLSISIFLNDIYVSMCVFLVLITILELFSFTPHTKYKYYLITLLLIAGFTGKFNFILIVSILSLVIFIIIQLLNFRDLSYYIFLLAFILYDIFAFITTKVNILDYYMINSEHIYIDFINFNSPKFLILLTYLISFICTLFKYKHTQQIIKPVLLTITFLLNVQIISSLSYSFHNIGILLTILFNPYFIVTLIYFVTKAVFNENFSNKFINSFIILLLISTNGCLIKNLYYQKINNPNQIYRASNDEIDIYKYMYEHEIVDYIYQSKNKVNLISQAPSTLAYIPNINVHNNYSYYANLLKTYETNEYVDNLTNIFALREFSDTEYYDIPRDYEDSVEELKNGEYNLMILRQDQLTNFEYNYVQLYKFYLAKAEFKVIYENDTYLLLSTI